MWKRRKWHKRGSSPRERRPTDKQLAQGPCVVSLVKTDLVIDEQFAEETEILAIQLWNGKHISLSVTRSRR
jgi:hypothetical protein